MLAGYFWLGLTGLYLLISPPGSGTFAYDAAVHGITIGFVLSMVFGHALIILPAITGVLVRYHPALYGPLVLLHASVALRMVSDYFELIEPRALSGPLTVIAFVGFAATIAFASRGPRPTEPTQSTSAASSRRS